MEIFAHRGWSHIYLENSMDAFLAADHLGVSIELDVHQSKDGELVVFHDENLKRMTGVDALIKDLTYDELTQYPLQKAGKLKTKEQTIPRLKDVLLALQKVGFSKTLNIELKTDVYTYEGLEKNLAQLLEELSLDFSLVISSFSYASLCRMHEVMPEFDYAMLVSDENSLEKGLTSDWIKALHLPYKEHPCPKTDKAIRYWTVDVPDQVVDCKKRGASAVFTNDVQNTLWIDTHYEASRGGSD